jgi:hypothetical protein
MLSGNERFKPIPAIYWNLSAAVYAYLYVRLSRLNIDILAESGFTGAPDLFPDCNMTNLQWKAKFPVLGFKNADR